MRGRARRLQILKALARIRPVNPPQRLARRNQAHAVSHDRGNWIGNFGRKILQYVVNDAAKPARRQASLPGRFVDRNDSANFQRRRSFLRSPPLFFRRVAENLELRLHQLQLATVLVFLHLAVERDHLPGLESIAQVGGIEPDALQPGPALAGSHLENGHAASAKQARGSDFGDDGRHFSRPQFGNPPRIYPVFVAERQVVQQVVDGVDALGRQHFGQARADAFDVLHGSGGLQHLKRC